MESSWGMKVKKDALIVESKKITPPENSVKIRDTEYWNVVTQLYEQYPEAEWYEMSQMDLDQMWFGLKELPTTFNSSFRFFEVVDKQKYLWAKLKYGI
jgi:hypothetical protein